MIGSYIFCWHMFFNKSFYIASNGELINCFFWTSFLFLQPFYLSTGVLSFMILESSVIHYIQLANLFPSFWLFFVLFWMLRLLVAVNKLCNVPHGSRIKTLETIFTKIRFGGSKEWVRSWSHSSLIKDLRTFVKKLSAVFPNTLRRKRKKRKKERQLQSVLHYTKTQ